MAGPLLKGLQIWGKGADQNFGLFLLTGPALMNFIKILSLFNTQINRPRSSTAIFNHVEQVPYSSCFKLGKRGHQNFGPFLLTGPALLNFIKILSLFDTQPNRPRASPAIFKHVGQVPYSRGFKFAEKGPFKILAHFCLQVQRFNTLSMLGRSPTQGASNLRKMKNFGPVRRSSKF